jgi:hypothetical protein
MNRVTQEQFLEALKVAISNKGYTPLFSTKALADKINDGFRSRQLNAPLPGDSRYDVTNAMTDNGGKVVYIRDDLSLAHTLTVVTHELAHIFMHGHMYDDLGTDRDKALNTPEFRLFMLLGPEVGGPIIMVKGEVEAELTAYAILSLFGGFEDKEWSESYVANYATSIGEMYNAISDSIMVNVSKAIMDIKDALDQALASKQSIGV